MSNKQDIIDFLDQNQGKFIDVSDKIWDNPEIRFELKESADTLIEVLSSEGFSVERNVAEMKDAFIATYGSEGPVIGFLAEYDALSNLSQVADELTKKPIKEGAYGHACGHNALGAGSLAAAVAIKEYMNKNNMKATIKFFGCPAEESGSGKAFMAREGVFKGVDSLITWHPWTENKIWGTSSLANFQVYFNFKGVSAHAASAPHLGRSALDAAELMNIGVNYLREHIIDEARVHYAYLDVGGQSPNVVQPTSSLLYFIRAPKSQQVKEIYDRIVKIAQGAALMTETELEIKWDSACSEYIINDVLGKVMYENMELVGEIDYTDEEVNYAKKYVDTLDSVSILNHEKTMKNYFNGLPAQELESVIKAPLIKKLVPYSMIDKALPGSTDVGDASFNAPTVQLTAACYPAGTAPHSWQWVATGKSSILHKGLIYAAKVMAMTALDLLESPETINKAKEEFDERLGGQSYQNYIPLDVKPVQ
ncbi:MAG: amidohydrolase [Tissierella sp.]|nr:amidohydrolase [Tissierella sp.]